MTLTKKEKAAVRKAIQMVHDREVSFSCDGLTYQDFVNAKAEPFDLEPLRQFDEESR